MKKNLTLAGNSWQLYINKPLAQLLGLNMQEYTVVLKIEDKTLFVQKINTKNADEIMQNALVKKLIKRTSGFGLNLTQPIMELLEINPENDSIELNIDNGILSIKKTIK